jgi:hypothetical protein
MNPSHIIVGAVLMTLAAGGLAQAAPPARDGNVWDGIAHEPNPGLVHDKERAAGVLPSQQQESAQVNAVERLARGMLQQERADGMLRDGSAGPAKSSSR